MTDRLRALRYLALAVSALAATAAYPADQLILGKKLLIKNPPAGATKNKVVHLGKDPSIVISPAGGVGDPTCTGAGGGGTSTLRIVASGGAGDITIPLPCTNWTTNAANTLYKYKDTTNATCTLVLVKNGVLAKAICKGSQVAIDLSGSMSPVAVVLTLNADAFCTEFGGTVVKDGADDKTFLRKAAAAPVACPAVGGPCVGCLATLAACPASSNTCPGSQALVDALNSCIAAQPECAPCNAADPCECIAVVPPFPPCTCVGLDLCAECFDPCLLAYSVNCYNASSACTFD